AGDVIAQVLFVHVVDLTALGTLVLHDNAHGRGLSLSIGTQTPDLGGLPFRVRKDERDRYPVHILLGYSTLVLQFLAAALDEHVEVQLLSCEPFERILTDGSKVVDINMPQETLFQVRVAQVPSIVFAQDALNMRRWQDLPNHIKYGGVVQGITDFLELVKQTLQHTTLDGISSHKIEDQTIALLAIAVNAAHALLQSIRIPGNVIVEQDVAAL